VKLSKLKTGISVIEVRRFTVWHIYFAKLY